MLLTTGTALLLGHLAFGVAGIDTQPIKIHDKPPASSPCFIGHGDPVLAAWQGMVGYHARPAVPDYGVPGVTPHHSPCDHPCGVSVAPGDIPVGQRPEMLVLVHYVPCSDKK